MSALHMSSTVRSRSSGSSRSFNQSSTSTHAATINNNNVNNNNGESHFEQRCKANGIMFETPSATATWRQHLLVSGRSGSGATVASHGSVSGGSGSSSGGAAAGGSTASGWDSPAGGVPESEPLAVPGLCSSVLTNNNDIVMPEYIVDNTTRTTYLKGKFLGKGGFARVHELTDLTTNRVYAGKIIAKSHITKPHHKEKIVREVELHSTLKHKHIVQFRHFFEDEWNVYIILENCPRKSLVHVMKQRNNFTEPEVRYYMRQLVDGVQYIHSQNVIHRDLKLGNMFLTEDMLVKIGDFGLATKVDNTNDGVKNVTVCGTPNYIAPEVLNKEGHGYEADVWAMGCIMYAMLVGQPPFETATLKETYVRIITNDYKIPPLFSTPARKLIGAMLQPLPLCRPTLEQILEHEFFASGYLPTALSPLCCNSMPKFPTDGPPPIFTARRGSSPVYEIPCPVLLAPSPPSPSQPVYARQRHPLSSDGPVPPVPGELNNLTNALTQLQLGERISRNHSVRGTLCTGKREKDQSFQSTIRHKITSVLCPDRSYSRKKMKGCSAATLYHVLGACLDNMPDTDITVPQRGIHNNPILFVTKWIDYSNKYGFGFELSDYSVGALFNDSTKLGLTPDKCRLEFMDLSGKLTTVSVDSIPATMEERFMVLCYFAGYMDENLTEGGDTKGVVWEKRKHPLPFMKRWLRTTRAIIMQLSTGALQINFFKDHTKIILSVEKYDYLVTYIDQERQATTYKLLHITNNGCSAFVRERLLYALNVLKEFASLDGDFYNS